MATVTNTVAINQYVIIESLSGSGDITPNTPLSGYGTIKVISMSVTEVSVGQNVFFKNGFAYSLSDGSVFVVANQSDLMFIRTEVI